MKKVFLPIANEAPPQIVEVREYVPADAGNGITGNGFYYLTGEGVHVGPSATKQAAVAARKAAINGPA